MNQQRPSTSQFRPTPGVFNSGSPYGAGGVSQPPPLPPRRMTSLYQNPYGGGYRTSMYGGNYGGYGGYGLGNTYAYGSPYGNYGYSHGPSGDVEHRFVQFAEESSRPAFQSIESIVQTFSSITMMLESTFFAMTSSFRAILNVAESIGRVRSMFGQLLSTFALIRFVKWLYRKIMYQLGLRPDDPNADAVWQRTVLDVVNGGTAGPATWPILVFLGLLFAIPYLINKLVNNASRNRIDVRNPEEWFKANEPVYSATAAYDFVAATSEEMSLRAGQKIWLAPESLQPKNMPGWQRATDSVNVGLVPSNYITIVGQLKRKTELNDDTKKIEKQQIDRTMDEAFLISNETDASAQDSIANES